MSERRTIAVWSQGAKAPNCPLTPSEHASVYAKSLHRACLILGGIERLSEALGVPQDILERWIRGEGEPPMSVFKQTVEILLLSIANSGRPV